MKNKQFMVSPTISDAKFILPTIFTILLVVLTFSLNHSPVYGQINGKAPVEESFYGPEFVKNSGEVDTSFRANLLNSFELGANVTAFVKQPDGKLVVAGIFTNVGGITKKTLVRLNPDGSVDNSFDVGLGAYNVTTLAVQPDGKILVGGSFTSFNNVSRNGIVRLNADGSVDESFQVSFQSGSTAVQKIILLSNGKILIVGSFDKIGEIPYPRIAVLEADGNVDRNFNPPFFSFNNGNYGSTPSISAAAVQPDGKIIIAGYFDNIGGYVRNRMARLESNGALDLSFDTGIGQNNQVFEILPTADGKILIGGDFTSINGIVRSKIARLNSNGSVDTAFNFISPGDITVRTMALQTDGKIVVGTDSSYYSQVNFPVVFRLNADGSIDSTFTVPTGNNNAGINGSVKQILLDSDGKVIIGGTFTLIGNTARSGLAKLNTDGTLDSSFEVLLGSSGTVTIITPQADGKILIGGNFSYVNGVAKNKLARLNQDGSVDLSFNPSLVQGSYNTSTFITVLIVQPDGKIIVGGNITSVNGTTTTGFFRLNADGTTDTSFSVTISGSIQTAALQPDGKIIIGGSFYQINNVDRRYLGRVNADGSLDTGFNAGTGPNGGVTKIVLQSDGKIIVAGTFDSFNGTQHRGIVRLNAAGNPDASFNADISSYGSSIYALAVQPDGKILIGGSFSQVNGVNRNRLARLNADGSLDTSFVTVVGQDGGAVNGIILEPNGKIIVAGNFNSIFGAVRRKVVRLFADGTVDDIFNPGSGPDGEVFALARQSNGKILIGGNFSVVDGVPRTGIARLRVNACVVSPLYDFDGDGKTDISVYSPQEGSWYRLNTNDSKYYHQLFGLPTDLIVPGDFDGDDKADIAVFRPSEGVWYILNSRIGFQAFQFGASGDKPLAADFDGDGKDDLAVFRPSNGTWYIRRSSLGFTVVKFGAATDIPVIADMDGDCRADVAVFRPSNGTWYWLQSSDSAFRGVQFGTDGDIPVAGDYDGDGKTDLSVYRPSTGTWYLLKSMEGFFAQQFGVATDRPIPADYDGDGKTDIAVFRNGTWYIIQSLNGKFEAVQLGESDDQPIPAAYLSR